MQILWTRTALDRLQEICGLLEKTSPLDARAWKETALAAARKLAARPHLGTLVAEVDYDETYRQIRLGTYRMIYRIDGQIIHIMTIHFHRPATGRGVEGGGDTRNS
jgi:plasmid stabilization system protein ParE